MFENYRVYKTDFAGRPLVVETGKMAQLANGECLVRYGETAVHVAATASARPRDGVGCFPLSVSYEERPYAVGRIPHSCLKREGRLSDRAVLTGRMIDRAVRPLFPKDLRNGVAIVCTVMSVDRDCCPEIAALAGTSVALSISDIPWNGPVSGASAGYVDREFVINPKDEQRKKSKMALTVASTDSRIVMIEAGAEEIPDDVMYSGILAGHGANRPIVEFIRNIQSEIGKPKFKYPGGGPDDEMLDAVRDFALDDVRRALDAGDPKVREEQLQPVYGKVHEKFDEICPGREAEIDLCLREIQRDVVRHWLLDEQKRVDGRKMDEIRPMSAEVGVLPRVHGSGLFTRGRTQVLTVATLGPVGDGQTFDGTDGRETGRYIHQYNMPPYSTGDTGPSRGPGRREIGHGALAERALAPVIPPAEKFPYALRLVSEVLSSDGSTSQASVCGSTLALMDAGVPIKAPVAGISCGMVAEGDRWAAMVDLQSLEAFFGDMDFKAAGTRGGITAVQMDLKTGGLTPDMVREALYKTHKARNQIIDEILLKAIPEPRRELSRYVPKVFSTAVPAEKIREVIGPGGRVVQEICQECGVRVNVEENGRVFVSGTDPQNCGRAVAMIGTIANGPERGAIYNGKVTRIADFGAFVEIAPGKEGLVPISQLDVGHVARVSDAVKAGDEVMVRVMNVDDRGRLNLSRREALMEVNGDTPEAGGPEPQPQRRPAPGNRGRGKSAAGHSAFVRRRPRQQ